MPDSTTVTSAHVTVHGTDDSKMNCFFCCLKDDTFLGPQPLSGPHSSIRTRNKGQDSVQQWGMPKQEDAVEEEDKRTHTYTCQEFFFHTKDRGREFFRLNALKCEAQQVKPIGMAVWRPGNSAPLAGIEPVSVNDGCPVCNHFPNFLDNDR